MAHTDPMLDELVRIQFDLDRVIADRQMGPPSHARSDAHVDRVEELAARLVRAVRGPGRPVHAPIGKTPSGQTIW